MSRGAMIPMCARALIVLAVSASTASGQVRQAANRSHVPSAGRPPGVLETVFVLPNDLRAGDCHMQNAVLTLRSDGSGHFQAQTRTDHTSSKDVWHQSFGLVDNTGRQLTRIQMADSPGMDSPNTVPPNFWYSYGFDFGYDHNLFNIVSFVDSFSAC
jgi:hypothetical protein